MSHNETLKKTTLGEVLTFQRGFDITKKEQQEGLYQVISSSGPQSTHNQFKVKGPGVVIGRKGTLGSVFYSEKDFWPHDTTLWVKDFHGNDPKFAYYFLKTLHLEQYDCGSSNPTLNRNHIHLLPVEYPSLPLQRKIAEVLSSYDKLIENNLRRIKILEDISSTVYQEWFIKFQFPGSENIETVESSFGDIPKGWDVIKVEHLVDRFPTGKKYSSKTVSNIGSVPVLDQGKSGIIGFHNEDPGVMASEDNPIIVFANHTCYQRIIHYPFSAIQNVLPFRSNKENERDIYWLHWATKDLVVLNDYKGHWPEFISKEVLLPPKGLCCLYGEYVKPMALLAYKLEKQNSKLVQMRDFLIPRLIANEINTLIESDLDNELLVEY